MPETSRITMMVFTGSKYAIMVVKVFLATLLRRYVLRKNKPLDVKDIKLKADLLKPMKTMTLRIFERVNQGIGK